MKYGPNTFAVEAFRQSLYEYHWFESVTSSNRHSLQFSIVDFDWMVEHEGFNYKAWNGLLSQNEASVDRCVFDNSRLDIFNAITRDFNLNNIVPDDSVDSLLEIVDETYGPDGSYYQNTFIYPHEYFELPHRLIIYAALEIMVNDLNPNLHFFQDIMTLFREGYWPVGWEGMWPHGKFLMWQLSAQPL
jgi:hypothetical protein